MNGDKQFIDENGGDPVSTALGALPRVTAPDGFESNVLRTVRGRALETRPASMAWLKVALPTAALALLAAFFWFSSLSTNEMPAVVVVEDPSAPKTASPELGRDLLATDTQSTDQPKNSAIDSEPEKELTTRRSNSENTQGSDIPPSQDFGAGQPSRPILPRGFDPESKTISNGLATATTVRLVDIVQTLGIRTALRDGEFVAESVAGNSLAKQAGVQAGDVIEAVNDVSLTSTATLSGRVDITSIRVRRDGKTLRLSF